MAIPGPAYKAAPTPVNTKIPVPITLPMPKKLNQTQLNCVQIQIFQHLVLNVQCLFSK